MDKMFESILPVLRIGSLSSHEIEEVIRSFLSILGTDYVDNHRLTVAQTFDALLSRIQECFQNVDNIPTTLIEDVFKIFVSIEHIPSIATEEENTDGCICLLKFLSFLKQHNNVEGDGDFTDLSRITDILGIIAEDLEQIRFLFDYRIGEDLLFPIDKLLVGIINNAQFLKQSRRVDRRDYYALKLAVRFFKKDTEGDRIVSKIRKDSNLKFIDYLNPDCTLMDTSDMLNYQKNGIMVFWNSSTKRLLIRSDRETYFDQNLSVSFEVDHEWTKDRLVQIGSFVELQCSETDKAYSIPDLMKTVLGRKKVVELFFSAGRNIFLPCAVRESEDGKLYPMNPFTQKDTHIIKGNKSYLRSNIRQAFTEYSNLALEVSRVNIMNRVCIGTFAMLAELDETCWEHLLEPYEEGSFYQNQMIQRWMRATNANAYEQFVLDYFKALQYCQMGVEKIREHEVKGQFVLPLKNEVRSIASFLNPVFETAKSIDVVEGVISETSEGQCVIIQGSGECRDIELVRDPECILTTVESPSAYFVDCDGELYVYEQGILKAVFGLKAVFSHCLEFDTVKWVSSERYNHLKKAIDLHRKALMEKSSDAFPAGEEFFEDQVYYRLVHNMVGYGVDAEKIEAYLKTIEGHQLLSFKDICHDSYFKMNDGESLYVPKDYYAADAVLSMIYDTYMKQHSTRNEFNLYDDRIEIRNGKYYRNGYKIKKVILLLDNFESGSAAINCIAAYFDIPTEDKELMKRIGIARNRVQGYYSDDGENRVEIKLNTILRENGCKLEVHAYYGTEDGKRK